MLTDTADSRTLHELRAASYDAVRRAHAPYVDDETGLFDAAFLLTRYRSEMYMLAIPAAVQKIAFPVLLAIGTMLGKYDKFADAPEPVLESQAGSRQSTSAV